MAGYGAVCMGENMRLVAKDGFCSVYKMEDAAGDGMMTCYSLFPGVVLVHSDIHAERCVMPQAPDETDLLCVDHCREGRMEMETRGGGFAHLGAGMVQIRAGERENSEVYCPLRHYHGLTVIFSVEEAQEALSASREGFSVDLADVCAKFCPDKYPRVMAAHELPEHIFAGLYTIPAMGSLRTHRAKVLELLLFLDGLDWKGKTGQRPYFHRARVEKIRAIERFITAAPERHYTLEELSNRFEIPLTAMKLCFKGVFGSGVYAYMRAWRMNAAAVMLRQAGRSVASVAAAVGYDNASKFSSAFRDVMGKTPSEYKKFPR
ncbi:MAG: AraC family transcriptional regulator [Oscillospiraceae bacterium]|jgi:AraC-like DNA-binding protein|nr:AraC family transcriptional regulator [Oscillospiraceae bacterium]